MSVYWALFLIISDLVGILPWEVWYFENSDSAGLKILNHRPAGIFKISVDCFWRKYRVYILLKLWRRRLHPTPVLLPGKFHGRRSLVGCSPWGHEELDMTERLHFHFSLSCIGEGNGNPLQWSCLENPRDRGAWWAVKWLSSSD